ncbi:serine protease [Vibrio cyclitrophicus]
MKKFTLLLVFSLFFTTSSVHAGVCLEKLNYFKGDEGLMEKELSKSVFLLERKSKKDGTYIPLGTATLITRSGHLITAKHLFEYHDTKGLSADEFRVTHADKTSYIVENIIKHNKYDISIVKVKGVNNYLYQPIRLSLEFNSLSSKVQMYSFTLDNPDKATISSTGRVTRKDKDNYYSIDQIKPYNGQSGGVIFNKNLHGVGILSGYIVDNNKPVTLYGEIIERDFNFIRAISTHVIQDIIHNIELDESNIIVDGFIDKPGPIPDSEIKNSLKYNPLSYYLAVVKIIEKHIDLIKEMPPELINDFSFQFSRYSGCFLSSEIARYYNNKMFSSLPLSTTKSILSSKINDARKGDNLSVSIESYFFANQILESTPSLNKSYLANLNYLSLELASKINESSVIDLDVNKDTLASLVISSRIKNYPAFQHNLTENQIHSSQQVLLSASALAQGFKSQYAGSQFALAASGLEDYRTSESNETKSLLQKSENDFLYHAAMTSQSEPNIPKNGIINIEMQRSELLNAGSLPIMENVDISGAIEQFESNIMSKRY